MCIRDRSPGGSGGAKLATSPRMMTRYSKKVFSGLAVALATAALSLACDSKPAAEPSQAQPTAEATRYVCPMHPEVTDDKPSQCPKCGMKLVPKKD